MRNSKAKAVVGAVVFIFIFVLIASALSYALAPASSLTRLSLHEFYEQEDIDILILGASHPLHGIDSTMLDDLTEKNTYNLASASQKALDSYYLLREAYEESEIETVIIELTYGMYTKFSGYDNPLSSMILFDYMKASANKAAYFWDAFAPEDWLEAILPAYRYREELPEMFVNLKTKLSPEYMAFDEAAGSYADEVYRGKGFAAGLDAFEDGNMGRVSPYKWDKTIINEEELGYLEKMISLCREKGSRVILLSMPMPYATLLQIGNYDEVHTFFADFAAEKGLPYFDLNLLSESAFARTDDLYYDSTHLNETGAKAITPIIAKIIAGNMPSLADHFSEMEAQLGLESVYLQVTKIGDRADVSAKVICGAAAEAEYRIAIKRADGTEEILTDFAEVAKTSFKFKPGDELICYAREAGKETISHWDSYIF